MSRKNELTILSKGFLLWSEQSFARVSKASLWSLDPYGPRARRAQGPQGPALTP